MSNIKIKLTREKFNFRFKQYEGCYFIGDVNEENNVVKYKITKDEKGLRIKRVWKYSYKREYVICSTNRSIHRLKDTKVVLNIIN